MRSSSPGAASARLFPRLSSLWFYGRHNVSQFDDRSLEHVSIRNLTFGSGIVLTRYDNIICHHNRMVSTSCQPRVKPHVLWFNIHIDLLESEETVHKLATVATAYSLPVFPRHGYKVRLPQILHAAFGMNWSYFFSFYWLAGFFQSMGLFSVVSHGW